MQLENEKLQLDRDKELFNSQKKSFLRKRKNSFTKEYQRFIDERQKNEKKHIKKNMQLAIDAAKKEMDDAIAQIKLLQKE